MLSSYVITIQSKQQSVDIANRCISSAAKFGVKAEQFKAYTPDDYPDKILVQKGVNTKGFDEVYSRGDNCRAAFLSHFSLWEKCVSDNHKYLIFEHDALVEDNIPTTAPFNKVMTIGKPSYGKFNTPSSFGINPLTHKRYFGGAHAYMITPSGARDLIRTATEGKAKPTDVYLNLDLFPWLQEYYPWPVRADDNFSTIQNKNGIIAKHNYSEGYKLI